MEFGITLLFTMGNVCLNMGVVFGVFLLLRPLLVRIVTPQQRVWLWYIFWYSALFFTAWGCISYHRVLPVTVWDLLGVSAARSYELFRGPLFLPPDYDGPGTYALTLPGGVRVPIALTDTLCLAVAAVYLAGVVCLAVWMVRRALALRRLGQRGTRTEVGLWSDFGKPKEEPDAPDTCPVWLAPNLPTSFALWNAIYLQEELPPERRRLVLLHELDHLCLRHGMIKGYMSFTLIAGWWNPLIWLGYRYTCLDMELSCDARTMERLSPQERREYAQTLVELGSGQRLWDVPLAFGESDGARRVRALLAWKPLTIPKKLLGLCAAALVMCLFLGTP